MLIIVGRYDINTYVLYTFLLMIRLFLNDEKKLESIVFYIEYTDLCMVLNINHIRPLIQRLYFSSIAESFYLNYIVETFDCMMVV
jgi:hypothetical protein